MEAETEKVTRFCGIEGFMTTGASNARPKMGHSTAAGGKLVQQTPPIHWVPSMASDGAMMQSGP